MVNIETKIVGDILTLTIDLSKTSGVSASGKSNTIASTLGNKKLDAPFAHVSFGLNVYSPVTK